MNTLLAIPSCLPGGLDAAMGMHFGHCDIYTLVEIEDGKVKSVATHDNPPHAQGGCLAPVQMLAGLGVKTLLAGGMG
ncbi:MAG: dinitrogenase iron-molybdenum cofactor biosynthesis protein, partial [Desulfovibrio sp.]|nr:dinitrogenase iron-molybdenum cofactor biosynthesis protein [Desulfovibrio sp.]